MNNKEYPLVSIIITCYNRAGSVWQSIESALNQDYENLEIIVTDNCSTDNSDEVIKNYTSDKRVKYSRNETNIGMAGNFKKAIYELASGEYFVNVCSDDYLINDKFVSQAVELINKYENVLVIKGKYQRLDERIGVTVNSNINTSIEFYKGTEWLNYGTTISFSQVYETLGWAGVLVERGKFIALNAFEYPTPNIDVFSNIKLLTKGNIVFIDEFCYLYRTLSNRAAYLKESSRETYLGLFKTVERFSYEDDTTNNSQLKDFYDKFYEYVIGYFMQFVYRYDKPEFRYLTEYAKKNHPEIFLKIQKSKKWKLYSLIYYNEHLGSMLSSMKRVMKINRPILAE